VPELKHDKIKHNVRDATRSRMNFIFITVHFI